MESKQADLAFHDDVRISLLSFSSRAPRPFARKAALARIAGRARDFAEVAAITNPRSCEDWWEQTTEARERFLDAKENVAFDNLPSTRKTEYTKKPSKLLQAVAKKNSEALAENPCDAVFKPSASIGPQEGQGARPRYLLFVGVVCERFGRGAPEKFDLFFKKHAVNQQESCENWRYVAMLCGSLRSQA